MSGFVGLKGLAGPIAVEHVGVMTQALPISHKTLKTRDGVVHAVVTRRDEGPYFLRVAQAGKGHPIDIPAELIEDFNDMLKLVSSFVP